VTNAPTIHATAVLVGARAALIRGPAGSGKSTLALRLMQAAQAGLIGFARLVGDDRVHVAAAHGRLLLRPAPALAGLIEIRGLGIRRLPFEPLAVAGWVIDLGAAAAARLPQPEAREAVLEGIRLPRLAVARGIDPAPAVITFFNEFKGSQPVRGSHI
jgi:hypothetical protein